MSDRTGLGLLELAMVETLGEMGAGPDDAVVKSSRVTEHAARTRGVGPAYGYMALCDLARDWLVNLPLIDFKGNPGSPDFGPADSKYTEVRLNPLGKAVLDAHRGDGAAVPVGMVNGTAHVDGRDPPLDPRRLTNGLRKAAMDASDDELIGAVGLPSFPTRCEVTGDLEQFAAGKPTRLQLRARFEVTAPYRFVISHLPLRVASSEVSIMMMDLADPHRGRLGIYDINDRTTTKTGTHIDVSMRSGHPPGEAIQELRDLWGLQTVVDVQLPSPLPQLLRQWTENHGNDGLVHIERANP